MFLTVIQIIPAMCSLVPEELVFKEELANTHKPQSQSVDLSNPAAAARELGMTERQFMAEQMKVLKEAEEKKKKEERARKAEEKRNKGENENTELEQVKYALNESISYNAQRAALEAFNKEKQEQDKQKREWQARAKAEFQQQGQGGSRVQKQHSWHPVSDHGYDWLPGEGSSQPPGYVRGRAVANLREHEMVHRQNIEQSHSKNNSLQGGRSDHDPQAVQDPHNVHSSPQQSSSQFTVSAEVSNPYRLGVGSAVQISATYPYDPPHYGVIKWIGIVYGLQGQVAGIELVSTGILGVVMSLHGYYCLILTQDEYLEGCSDGTLKSTGEKFFSCPPGRGLYFPLTSLTPDPRFADVPAQTGHTGYSQDNCESVECYMVSVFT